MNTPKIIRWRADFMALFGLVRRTRKAAKMTQAQAGQIVGLSERSYRDIENGHKDIGAIALFQLCAALGIRVYVPEAERNRKEVSGSEVV